MTSSTAAADAEPDGQQSSKMMITKDEPMGSGVQLVLSLTSTEEMQAKIHAADLAARQAIYERNLLAHQLEADSHERMRLQTGLKELALEHKRVVRAAMAAELEASGLRQQAADAAAAASTAQAQAVQAVQAAQQQLALLQAQQQQLLQSQQSMLGGQGLMQRGVMGGQATPYIGADGKIVSMPMQGVNPFMLGTLGGGMPPMSDVRNTSRESNADLTEGLFDDLDLGGPHGSLHCQPGAPNLFAPEVYTYPYGPGYRSSRKRLSTSSAPGGNVPMPSPPGTRRDHQGAPQLAGGRTAGPRRTVDLANLSDMESARAQGTAAAAAAGEASQAAAAAAAAKGAAAKAGEASAEEPQSVRMEPHTAARAATQAAKSTMIGASDRLAAASAEDTAPTEGSNTTHGDLSTTQLADREPSEVGGASDEGATTAATEEGTEDTISTTTVFPDGNKRASPDKQARGETSWPSTPPHSAIEEAPELEAAAQPQNTRSDEGSKASSQGRSAMQGGEGAASSEADSRRRPPTNPPIEVASFPGARTSIDNALSEVQEAMGHMYQTQSDSSLARHGMMHAPSMQNLPLVPSVPSAPDLREKDSSTSNIYLPMLGGGNGLSESPTPSLGMGADHASQEPSISEYMSRRDQLLKLSTCNVVGEGASRTSKYGGSPPSSTPVNALVGSPGGGIWGAPKASPGGMRKVNSDGKALAASQLLSHSPFAPSKQQLTSGDTPANGDSGASQPQQGGLAAELQSAGSLAQGLVGVAGEFPAPEHPPTPLRTSAPPAIRTDSPFLNCKSFSVREHPATDAGGFLSPTRSGTMSPPTPFSPPSSFTHSYGVPPIPHTSSASQLVPPAQLQSSKSWQQQPGAGQLPRAGLAGPISMQHSYQEPPLQGLPPGPALPVRPTSRSSLTGLRQPGAAASVSQMRGVRSGSVSPGAYAAYAGVGDSGMMTGRYSTLTGRPVKTWGANRPPSRSGISTPHSTSALSMSRGRSGIMSPGGGGIGQPLMAAQCAGQSKLDEDLHLLQALDKITKERRNEINAEMESMQLEDDTMSSCNAVTGNERGAAQPSAMEAARVKKLQEELNHAKAEASRAEAERAEAMRTRHEVAVHFQNVLAQQQKQVPGDQQEGTGGKAGDAQGDVCAVIEDDAMRQRCRDLLSDILGTTSEEQQVPPAYMVAPAAPVGPIHVQQQVSSMQAMLSKMEKVVGRLNESLEREEASRQEKEAMNKRLQALENMVMKK